MLVNIYVYQCMGGANRGAVGEMHQAFTHSLLRAHDYMLIKR
jgi:hypothetical protein